MSSDNWTYEDSSNWGLAATLQNQSPINIDTGIAEPCHDLCELKFHYKETTTNGEIKKTKVQFNKYQNLKILYESGSNIIYKNNPFTLKEITFHTPSLHTIDGIRCDLEICMIHSLDDNPYTDNGVIICCLFNEGNYFGKTETFVHQFINEIKINSTEEVNVSSDWSASQILPDKKSFYLYEGTVPFPPNSPMTNIVMDTIGNISPTNLELLKINLGQNIRPIQSLQNRVIYYNSGNVFQLPNAKRNVTVSNNKYFRCKPKHKSNINTYTNINTNTNTNTTNLNKGLEDSTKLSIRNIFLLLTFFSILAHSFFITKRLFKLDYAQKLLIAIVGVDVLGATNADTVLKLWRNSCQPSTPI
jgi:carbonic anhydrase